MWETIVTDLDQGYGGIMMLEMVDELQGRK